MIGRLTSRLASAPTITVVTTTIRTTSATARSKSSSVGSSASAGRLISSIPATGSRLRRRRRSLGRAAESRSRRCLPSTSASCAAARRASSAASRLRAVTGVGSSRARAGSTSTRHALGELARQRAPPTGPRGSTRSVVATARASRSSAARLLGAARAQVEQRVRRARERDDDRRRHGDAGRDLHALSLARIIHHAARLRPSHRGHLAAYGRFSLRP